MQTTRDLQDLDEDDCPPRTHGENLTCRGCGRTFQTPILATVSISGRTQTYYACPRCMTKISSFEVPAREKGEEEPVVTAEQESAVNCAHFFGYLNRHQRNTPFPDECLTCPKMVDCMLLH